MQKKWETFAVTDAMKGYHGVLDNGLRVYLVPQTDFEEAHGAFVTQYGSTMQTFINPETGAWYQSPAGVAHFLEHKLFDEPDGKDIFLVFNELGASANAYTTQKQTVYTFITNQRVPQAVEVLLDYVQSPYFTEQSVEKEKGIIEQEILMYDDNYDWVGYRLALAHAYPEHPVGVDIAGSVTSIYTITKDDLATCYQTFYHPSNMSFILSGNFDVAAVQQTIEANQGRKTYDLQAPIVVEKKVDGTQAKTKAVRQEIAAGTNYITILYKDICGQQATEPLAYQELIIGMILDMLFSELSVYAENFLMTGLIEEELSYSQNYQEDYAYIMWQTTTKKPSEFIEAFRFAWFEGEMMNAEQFARVKKATIGSILQIQNNPAVITRLLTNTNVTPKMLHEWLLAITFDEVVAKYEQIKAHLDAYLTFVFLEGDVKKEKE